MSPPHCCYAAVACPTSHSTWAAASCHSAVYPARQTSLMGWQQRQQQLQQHCQAQPHQCNPEQQQQQQAKTPMLCLKSAPVSPVRVSRQQACHSPPAGPPAGVPHPTKPLGVSDLQAACSAPSRRRLKLVHLIGPLLLTLRQPCLLPALLSLRAHSLALAAAAGHQVPAAPTPPQALVAAVWAHWGSPQGGLWPCMLLGCRPCLPEEHR